MPSLSPSWSTQARRWCIRRGQSPPPGGVSPRLKNTQPFDVFALPTISTPRGFSRNEMPIGLQISGLREWAGAASPPSQYAEPPIDPAGLAARLL